MPAPIEFRVADGVFLTHDGRGRFSWSGGNTIYGGLPPMRCGTLRNPATPSNDPELIESMQQHIDQWIASLPEITHGSMSALAEFLYEQAPFTERWTDREDWEQIVRLTSKYVLCTEPQDDVQWMWPLVLAHILCHQCLADINPFDLAEIEECEENIIPNRRASTAVDIREMTLEATGTYSRPLGRAVAELVRNKGSISLSILTLLEGMPPEHIISIISEGGWNLDGRSHYHGIPRLPEWVLNAPASRRLIWSRNLPLLAECINLYRDIHGDTTDIPSEVFNTPDLVSIHEELIMFSADTHDKEYSFDTTPVRLPGLPEVLTCDSGPVKEIIPVTTCNDLRLIGVEMAICVSSTSYLKRLKEGTSVYFLATDDKGDKVLMIEYSPNGRHVETATKGNGSLEGIEVKPIHSVIESALRKAVSRNG